MSQENNQESQFNILKNALQFYADLNNYEGNELVLKDKGEIARFAFKSINDLNVYEDNIKELRDLISENNTTEDNIDQDELMNKINQIIKQINK